MTALELDDGRFAELGEAAVLGSKNDTRFAAIGSVPVVVKVQGRHGDVQTEARALEYLADVGVRVPQVIGTGTTPDGRPFLVVSREPGSHTETPEGWARFGRDLAALANAPVDDCPFPRVSTASFVADHLERLMLVRPLLTRELADEIGGAIALVGSTERLALTHGDPGTGNYLDSGDDDEPGVLLDWESPSVSPFGLDLGRAAFIALLDLRNSGIPELLAPAVITGYLERLSAAQQMSSSLVRAWVTVAGLQFIHRRHVRPLMAERTAHGAAQVLTRYLAAPDR